MKFLLLLIFVLTAHADDIERIHSIVNDITKLRMDYKKSQERLHECQQKVRTLENQLKIATSLSKIKDNNTFPKLKMRDKAIYKKAATYRLKENASIYDSVDGEKIGEWTKGTSFTSTQRTQRFILITGYFENRQWRKAHRSLWVRVEDAFKRDQK